MHKQPEPTNTSSTTQNHANTVQQQQQQWAQVYQFILDECTEKAQAPTVRCIDAANRIDELFAKLCVLQLTDTPAAHALYTDLHKYLEVVAAELAQLHFTKATPVLKKLQEQIPQHSKFTLFSPHFSPALGKSSISQFTNLPETYSPPIFSLVMDLIVHLIIPHLRRHDLQHWFWSCKFFNASPEMLQALKDKPMDPNTIAAGYAHTLMYSLQGDLYSWGLNESGQLGLGHQQNQNTPQRVTTLEGKSVQSISCGSIYSIALCHDRSVYSWGNNSLGQLGLGHKQDQNTPQRVTALDGKSVQSIACGGDSSIAVCTDGSVYSWGENHFGQLGLGHKNHQNTPQLVTALEGKPVQSISCGSFYSIAVCRDGSVYSWGNNNQDQLGLGHDNNQNTPQLVEALNGKSVQHIACGGAHVIALCRDGSVYSWGNNSQGRLGLGHDNNQNTPQLVKALNGKPVQRIACGGAHVIALCRDGSVYSWGLNESGQLGLGHQQNQNIPQLVKALDGQSIQSITCGVAHSVVVYHDGSVYSWGSNNLGQLGLGHKNNQNTPQLLPIKQNSTHHDNALTVLRSCALM